MENVVVNRKDKFINYFKRHKRFLVIISGIILLNIIYGFDTRFTIINALWILISIIKIGK
jgi:hypothetical protein